MGSIGLSDLNHCDCLHFTGEYGSCVRESGPESPKIFSICSLPGKSCLPALKAHIEEKLDDCGSVSQMQYSEHSSCFSVLTEQLRGRRV